MLTKWATFKLSDFQSLNQPRLADFIVDQNIKVAANIISDTKNEINTASQKEAFTRDGDNTIFDLEAEIQKHPDSLYFKNFAIKADEMNDNGDYFSKAELIKATHTFVGCPVFTNHANQDINQARGKVLHSWWDEEKNGIMIIGRVDAVAYPQLARLIKEEIATGTSMGAQVAFSICSICHNYSETQDTYCAHIKNQKTRLVSARKVKCQYHKNGKEEQCPICGSKKGESNLFDVEKKAFEYNYGIRFIEDSLVTSPACHECGITEVIDPVRFRAKVAEIERLLPALIKAAQSETFCTNTGCHKIAGQEQLNSLNQALELLTSVSTDMLKQKDQIDLEFLTDLVKVLAELQAVVDELTQQGYGRLPSPGQGQDAQTPPSPTGEQPAQPPTIPVNPTPGGGSKIHTGPAGSAGTVTGPLANIKHINLEKLANDIIDKSRHIGISTAALKQKIIRPKLKFHNKTLLVN